MLLFVSHKSSLTQCSARTPALKIFGITPYAILRCWSFYIHLSNQIQRQTRRKKKNSRDNSASQGALGRVVLSAEDHLHWACVHTSKNHPLPHLGQSWAGIQLTTILSACILSSRPENLSSGTSSRPYHTIQNNWVSLLTPHVDLASKDQSFLSISETSRGIVGIDQSPVLDR
jgi:hypothetical protein